MPCTIHTVINSVAAHILHAEVTEKTLPLYIHTYDAAFVSAISKHTHTQFCHKKRPTRSLEDVVLVLARLFLNVCMVEILPERCCAYLHMRSTCLRF